MKPKLNYTITSQEFCNALVQVIQFIFQRRQPGLPLLISLLQPRVQLNSQLVKVGILSEEAQVALKINKVTFRFQTLQLQLLLETQCSALTQQFLQARLREHSLSLHHKKRDTGNLKIPSLSPPDKTRRVKQLT